MPEVWRKYGESMVKVWLKVWFKYGKSMGKSMAHTSKYGPYMAAILFKNFGYGYGKGSPYYGPYMAIHTMDF